MNHTFTEDSLAPMHKPIPLSVESSPYRRMPSRDIARLSVNDEIILMIPEVNVNTSPQSRDGIKDMQKRIDSVLMKSCTGMTSSERCEQLANIKNRHRRIRGKGAVYEFPVRVRNYAERHRLANNELGDGDLDRLWQSVGFGVYVELCGYARTSTALIRMKHIGYAEVFHRIRSYSPWMSSRKGIVG